jgi:hypothetical protein
MTEKPAAKASAATDKSTTERDQSLIANQGSSGIIEMQIEAARAISEISGRIAQAATDLMERQAAYFKTSQELLRNALTANRDGDLATRLSRQNECFRELTQSSVKHVTDVTEITAACCCDAVDHMTKIGASLSEAAIQKSKR